MDENRKKTLDKIAKLIEDSGEFREFHGNVTFNMAFGKVKNYGVNQSFLPDNQKKT